MIIEWLQPQIPSISTGEMLRGEIAAGTPLGLETKSVIASGGLVGDEIINRIVRHRISQPDCARGFMLDGYPRTLGQAEFLDEELAAKGMSEPVVVHLDVPAEVLISRIICRRQCRDCGARFNILSRRPHIPGRCDECSGILIVRYDDREEVIRERLRAYEAQTQPVLAHYYNGLYCHIPGDRSPVYIFEAITHFLEPFAIAHAGGGKVSGS